MANSEMLKVLKANQRKVKSLKKDLAKYPELSDIICTQITGLNEEIIAIANHLNLEWSLV